MKRKQWSIWLTCVLVAVLMIAGMAAVAAEYGSQSDPLVTLSYIEQILLPQSRQQVDQQLEEYLNSYDGDLTGITDDVKAYIDKKLRSFASGEVDEELVDAIAAAVVEQMGDRELVQAQWATVELDSGDKITCGAGCQIILRSGKATANTTLMDMSDGETLAAGKSLASNHLYVVRSDAQCFTLNRDSVLLICGSYTAE